MANPFWSPLEARFWPDGDSRDMWMIVDGARDRRVYSTLIGSYMDFSCLYAGELAPALERAAPYIRELLKKKVAIRTVPNLKFEYDDTPKKASRIDELIHKLGKERGQ